MPTTMNGRGDAGTGAAMGASGLGAYGKESPSRPNTNPRSIIGNPAVGASIVPTIPPAGGNPTPQMGGMGGGGNTPGNPTTTASQTAPWVSPWGSTYSPNDVASLEADPTTLLMELLSSQGRNNPLQVARQGQLPDIFAALAPYLNSALTTDAGMSPGLGASTIAQMLGQYETPGAGGVDVAALLNAVLNPQDPGAGGSLGAQGMYNMAQTPSSDLNGLISAVLGLASPIMAPYLQNAMSQRQSEFGQANLDANGGGQLGSYGQWLLGQTGQ